MPLLNGLNGREGLAEKGAAELQPLWMNAVANALRQVPLHGKAGLRKLLAGDEHGIDGNDLVHVAMHKKDSRRRRRVLRQGLDCRQRAGIADDRRRRGRALEPDTERHHGALAETHQPERVGAKIEALKLGVEKGFERGRGARHTADHLALIAKGEVEPLPAHRRHAARLRRMGGGEGRMGQERGPFAPQADQVVAVGAIAMEEYDELPRRAPRRRRKTRSVDQRQLCPLFGDVIG